MKLTPEIRKERKKECDRRRYLENADRINAKRHKQYLENRKIFSEKNAKYYSINAEKIKEERRKYYSDNVIEIKARHRKYYLNNMEKIKECSKQWQQKHPDRTSTKLHPERHREIVHQRRIRKYNGIYENINHTEIYERDKWICGICHKPVNKKFKYPNPMSKSLDHIIPLILGGSHTRNNVQLAHLGCNLKAGISGVKQLRLPISTKFNNKTNLEEKGGNGKCVQIAQQP